MSPTLIACQRIVKNWADQALPMRSYMIGCIVCSLNSDPSTELWYSKARHDQARLAACAQACVNALIAGYQAGRLDRMLASIKGLPSSGSEAPGALSDEALLPPDDEGIEGLVGALTEGLCKDHAALKEPFVVAWHEMKGQAVC